jgi:hypothetical protein
MEDTHITELLAAYAEGECTAAECSHIEAHLAACSVCRADLESMRLGFQAVAALPLVVAPDSIWEGIQRELRWRLARRFLAVAATLLIGAAIAWQLRQGTGSRWEVTGLPGITSARAGEWIETGETAAARVKIGSLGVVDVRANSRLRMLETRGGEQRLALERGQIHAKIAAPPRLFFVETGAGTAIDLGCEYDLACDRDGNGFLRVMQGWVSYERDGSESLVPAGASCRTRAGRAPDTPYFDDAPALFVEALSRFDAGGQGSEALLAAARAKDTLTLWHLLSRVANDGDRLKVFERMVSFASLPAGISREGVLALDKDALRRWREELAWTW